MGYKIVYGKPKRNKVAILRLSFLTGCFFLLFSCILRISRPEIAEMLHALLISEELHREAEQLAAVASQWLQWEEVSDAVTVFCQELFCGQ